MSFAWVRSFVHYIVFSPWIDSFTNDRWVSFGSRFFLALHTSITVCHHLIQSQIAFKYTTAHPWGQSSAETPVSVLQPGENEIKNSLERYSSVEPRRVSDCLLNFYWQMDWCTTAAVNIWINVPLRLKEKEQVCEERTWFLVRPLTLEKEVLLQREKKLNLIRFMLLSNLK